jgi:hypothetical protein
VIGVVGYDSVLREWDVYTGAQVGEQHGVLTRAVSPGRGGESTIATITTRHTITVEQITEGDG